MKRWVMFFAGALALLFPFRLHCQSNDAIPTSVAGDFAAKNLTSIGPRYDVTQFEAKGRGIADDTAAIQAAFTACYNGGGGTVEFPGPHAYRVSGTIYAYDSCAIEGQRGQKEGGPGSLTPPMIYWDGPNTESNTANVTAATIVDNQTQPTPLRSAMDPANRPAAQLARHQIQATAANSFAVNEWVELSGCKYAGLNNVVGQVAAANPTSFTLLFDGPLKTGTYSETCTATQTTVVIAFDSVEHETDTISDLEFNNHMLGGGYNTPEGVDVYFSGRIDSGNNLSRVWFESPHYFGAYYAFGGEDGKIEEGSRGDGSDYYQIYWRVGATDRLTIVNSQFGPGNASTHGASTGGGGILVDNAACSTGNTLTLNLDHMVMENDINMKPGLADIALLDCGSTGAMPQFKVSIHASGIAAPAANTGITIIKVSPQNDLAASLDITDSEVATGSNTTNIIVGMPYVSLFGQFGKSGYFTDFHYFPSLKSWGLNSGSRATYTQPAQILGDLYLENLFQFTVPGSLWLNSDTRFAALPSGATLAQGTVIAPPAYFDCGTGANCGRYAVDVVQAAGTVGTLSGITCTANGVSPANVITCDSATGLMVGQYITTPSGPTRIVAVNATNPAQVLVTLANNQPAYASQPISYTPPGLGKEMQLITKASAPPTTGTWLRGDFVENSSAAANGIAGWVNVAAGSPGTWAAVPAGNASGEISGAQISNGSNIIYRCTTAGTLPVGALTITRSDCGASVSTGLTSQ